MPFRPRRSPASPGARPPHRRRRCRRRVPPGRPHGPPVRRGPPGAREQALPADRRSASGTGARRQSGPGAPVPESESDWDAARLGHGPYGDPRIGRPSAAGTLLALLAVLAALTAPRPLVAVLVLLAWVALARTADRSVTSLVMRRHERGARGSDVAVAVASSPWHLVVGARRRGGHASCSRSSSGVCAMFATALVLRRADRLGRARRRRPAARGRGRVRGADRVVGPGGGEPAAGQPQHRARATPGADGRPGRGRRRCSCGGRAPGRRASPATGRRGGRARRRPAGSTTSCRPRDAPVRTAPPPRLMVGDAPTEPMPMADLLRRTPYRHTRIPGEAAEDAEVRRGARPRGPGR